MVIFSDPIAELIAHLFFYSYSYFGLPEDRPWDSASESWALTAASFLPFRTFKSLGYPSLPELCPGLLPCPIAIRDFL